MYESEVAYERGAYRISRVLEREIKSQSVIRHLIMTLLLLVPQIENLGSLVHLEELWLGRNRITQVRGPRVCGEDRVADFQDGLSLLWM